jgi:preprotein translocase subunit SecY
MGTDGEAKGHAIPASAGARRGRLHAYAAICLAIFVGVLVDLFLKWPNINQSEIVARVIVAVVLGVGGAVLLWLGYRNA